MVTALEPLNVEPETAPAPPLLMVNAFATDPADPVVFWLNVGQVNEPVLKLPDWGVPKIGVVNDGLMDSTVDPLPVEVVTPVPPFATANVPARVIAPVVAVLGVKPVVPALNEETPSVDKLTQVGAAAPLLCKTWPEVPAAVKA